MSWSGPLCIPLVWDSLCILDFYVYFFIKLRKFSFIIFSNKFSISCSSSSPSGTPIIGMLECFKLSHRFLSLSSIFWTLVSSVSSGWMFIPSFFPNPWFESQFPSLHCWFPVYLLSFTLHSLHFFLYFVTVLNQFCEILITSVLNSASDRLSISLSLSSSSTALICSFIWAIFLCLSTPVIL